MIKKFYVIVHCDKEIQDVMEELQVEDLISSRERAEDVLNNLHESGLEFIIRTILIDVE